jgi:hypothetical protein
MRHRHGRDENIGGSLEDRYNATGRVPERKSPEKSSPEREKEKAFDKQSRMSRMARGRSASDYRDSKPSR